MNKFVKACYNSWQCRRSVKVGIAFLIISLVLFLIPLRVLSADNQLNNPADSGQDGNGRWVSYSVQDNHKTSYTYYADSSCNISSISFEAEKETINDENNNNNGSENNSNNSKPKKESFKSRNIGTENYNDGNFTVTFSGDLKSVSILETDPNDIFFDLTNIKIYIDCQSGQTGSARIDWGNNGSEYADLSECDSAYWHWILTPGGNAEILSATLYVTYSDNAQEQITGGTRSEGEKGAFHFDAYHTGVSIVSAYAEYTYSGNMNNPVLTISNSNCENPGTSTSSSTSSTIPEESTTTSSSTTSTTITEETTTTAATTTTLTEETTTTAIVEETTTTSVLETTTVITGIAGIEDEDLEGFIEVAGIKELPYTGINSIFLFTGIALMISGILSLAVPKMIKNRKNSKNVS